MTLEANGCGGGVQLLQTPGHGAHVVGVEVEDEVSTKAGHLDIVPRPDSRLPGCRIEPEAQARNDACLAGEDQRPCSRTRRRVCPVSTVKAFSADGQVACGRRPRVSPFDAKG